MAEGVLRHKQVMSAVSVALKNLPSRQKRPTAGQLATASDVQVLRQYDGTFFMNKVVGTVPWWTSARSEVNSIIHQLGPCHLFLTLNPARPKQWADFFLLFSPERFKTLDDVRKTSASELASLAYKMPVEWAMYFEYRLQQILDKITGDTSPIGRCTNYVVTIEEQHRGWLHAHCLLWMENAPDVLTAEGKAQFPDWIEKTVKITTSLPGGDMTAEEKEAAENDPEFGTGTTLLEKRRMIYANQRHRCVEGHCDPNKCRYPHLDKVWPKRAEVIDDPLTKKSWYALHRKPSDVGINQYNEELAEDWQGNMDLQPVGSGPCLAEYTAGYTFKGGHGQSRKELNKALKRMVDENRPRDPRVASDVRTAFFKLAFAIARERLVSEQEAAWLIMGRTLAWSTVDFVFVNARFPQNRSARIKRKEQLLNMPYDDTDVVYASIIDHYEARPVPLLGEMSLFEFVCTYAKEGALTTSTMGRAYIKKTIPPQPSKDGLPRMLVLRNQAKFLRRVEPPIVRIPMLSQQENGQEYWYQLLVLHLPFEKEAELQMCGKQPEDLFRDKKDFLKERLDKYAGGRHRSFMESLDRAMTELDEFDKHSPKDGGPGDDDGVVRPEADQMVAAMHKDEDSAAADGVPAEHLAAEADNRSGAAEPGVEGVADQDKVRQRVIDEALRDHRLGDQEYEEMLSHLTPGQKYIVDWLHHVYETRRQYNLRNCEETYPPFCLFLSGEGGTGKTFLLKVMREKIERMTSTSGGNRLPRVDVGAPTGIAASHIPGAGTYHLKLGVRPGAAREGLKSTASGLDLTLLKGKLRNLVAFFLDEVSMVGDASFEQMSARCCELKGNRDAAFGGLDVIFFGDLYQLPPVKQAPVYKSAIWRSEVGFYELTENIRQGGDTVYRGIVQRNRLGKTTEEDIEVLSRRVIGPIGPPEQAVKLASLRDKVANINTQALGQLLALHRGSLVLYIDLRVDDLTKYKSPAERGSSRRMVVNLLETNFDDRGKNSREPFQLGHTVRRMALTFIPIRGQRVMLITNVAAHDHLVNGQTGEVVGVSETCPRRRDKPWHEIVGIAPPMYGTVQGKRCFPETVWVCFDDPSVGRARKERLPAHLGSGEAVPISAYSIMLRSNGGTTIMVSQFPIVPAYALTIHKAQGMTLQQAAVDPTDTFQPALLYVALSRVTSLAGLSLLAYVTKAHIKPRSDIDAEMDRLRKVGLTRIVPVKPERPVRRTGPAPPARPDRASVSECVPSAAEPPAELIQANTSGARSCVKPAAKRAPEVTSANASVAGANKAPKKAVPAQVLNEQLCAYGLQLDEGTPMDGNCLFHAVARTANRNLPDATYDDVWLRAHMFENVGENHLMQMISGTEDPAEYMERLSMPGQWAGQLETALCARLLNVPITVWGHTAGQGMTYNPDGREEHGVGMAGLVIVYNGLNHYYATMPPSS